ncbi:hypothetical protein ES332_D04G201400v1 [Gossypium tomentosum]|uniref:Secreted protein n=1 Tax=Gossypium tomentosum TaxID=34277 RepID=A0A5D2LGY3_GOSTO|nr:hypothetical protein ES332_D04G201400v1 [Gossypium tomentosum]
MHLFHLSCSLLLLFDLHDQVQSMENAVCERVRELLVSKVPCIWKSLRTCAEKSENGHVAEN